MTYRITDHIQPIAYRQYEQALREGAWRKFVTRFTHRCNDLVAYRRVFEVIENAEREVLGLQELALHEIVGSSGRFRDFDLVFRPLRKERDGRWIRVAQARYSGIELPPPYLIKIRDRYFVEDGNHRISVARIHGDESIMANVIEIDGSSLETEASCTRLGFRVGYTGC